MKRPGRGYCHRHFLYGKTANESKMGNLTKRNSAPAITWRSLADRLQAHWALKLILLVVLNFSVYGPYIFLQHHHFFPTITMRPTFFDRAIPFWPWTVSFYLSISLLMPIGPFLMNQREQILRYAAGILLIGLLANVVFVFWPTVCPRPESGGTDVIYQALVSVDQPFHAFPSLHAAFAIYSALCGILVFRELGWPSAGSAGLWLWVLLILCATLTTKQHVVADLIAGSVLGFGSYHFVFSRWTFPGTKESPLPGIAKPQPTSLNPP